jgi:hypothetical protein
MNEARKFVALMLALGAIAALASCGSGDGTSGPEEEIVSGKLVPLADVPPAYSDVSGEADLTRGDESSTMSVSARGLEPDTAYIAHLHTGGCDQADPGGPHFQFEKGGSEEPPNEIHLQFTSDAAGEAKARVKSEQPVPPGEAGSIVLHLDEPHHEMTAEADGEVEALFIHEGVDHSKEGAGHEGAEGHHGGSGHAHSDKIACAELEGSSPVTGESTASADDVPTIVVRGGEPVGGVQKLEFDAGEEIRFRVSSDAAEEIHVHGYDIAKDVPAGGTVEFAFPAELEGIYEAELEELGVQIAELQINP